MAFLLGIAVGAAGLWAWQKWGSKVKEEISKLKE